MSKTVGTVAKAYGILWRDLSGNAKCIAARKELLTLLDRDEQKRGIEYAISIYGPTTEAEILGEDDVSDCIDGCCVDAESGCDLCTRRCDVCNSKGER